MLNCWLFTSYGAHSDSYRDLMKQDLAKGSLMLALPKSDEIESMQAEAQKYFLGITDPFSDEAIGAFQNLEKLVLNRLSKNIPFNAMGSAFRAMDRFKQNYDWGPCWANASGGTINLPEPFYNSAVGIMVRTHEFIHLVQRYIRFPSSSAYKKSFEDHFDFKAAFLTEKTAMQWEWLAIHLVPEHLKKSEAKHIDTEVRLHNGEKFKPPKSDLGQETFTIDEIVGQYARQLRNSNGPLRTYLLAEWKSGRYSPYDMYQRLADIGPDPTSIWNILKTQKVSKNKSNQTTKNKCFELIRKFIIK